MGTIFSECTWEPERVDSVRSISKGAGRLVPVRNLSRILWSVINVSPLRWPLCDALVYIQKRRAHRSAPEPHYGDPTFNHIAALLCTESFLQSRNANFLAILDPSKPGYWLYDRHMFNAP